MSGVSYFWMLAIALTAGWAFYDRSRYEEKIRLGERKPGRKTYLVEPLQLPFSLILILIIIIIQGSSAMIGSILAPAFAVLFLYISVYYGVLLALLPLLRRFISARACATLWLLPNLLYFTTYMQDIKIRPLFIITLPERWLALLASGWAVGFALVLLGQLVSHQRYRRYLLHDAQPVTDAAILSQWNNGQWQHEVKHPLPLLYSHNTTTPVTIGCFERTMRLVLPRRRYTEQELDLIFRHELRHIQRCDTRTKAWLGFCVAMCWFNPLLWIARRRVAEDLELSCDEAVLAGSDETTRRQYAELLLSTAGDGRGYTTCLSGTANALRYRLKNVIAPRPRFSGGIVVSITMLVLLLGAGSIALAGSPATVQELILAKAPAQIAIESMGTYRWPETRPGYMSVYDGDEAALTTYLGSLTVQPIYGSGYPRRESPWFYVDYAEKEAGKTLSLTRLELGPELLWANIPYDELGRIAYLVQEDIDWDYLASLLDFDAVDPDPAPQPAELLLYFNWDNPHLDGQPLTVMGKVRALSQGGVIQEINAHGPKPTTGGVAGAPVTAVQLDFTYWPRGGYRVKIESWDYKESYYVTSEELTDDTLPLAPYSAHYTVSGTFATVRDTVYEMEFYFDVELPEE